MLVQDDGQRHGEHVEAPLALGLVGQEDLAPPLLLVPEGLVHRGEEPQVGHAILLGQGGDALAPAPKGGQGDHGVDLVEGVAHGDQVHVLGAVEAGGRGHGGDGEAGGGGEVVEGGRLDRLLGPAVGRRGDVGDALSHGA